MTELVAVTQNTWAPITYTDDFVALAQVSTLQAGSVVHQFPNLSVIPLDGSSAGDDTATLTRTQTYAYKPNTATFQATPSPSSTPAAWKRPVLWPTPTPGRSTAA